MAHDINKLARIAAAVFIPPVIGTGIVYLGAVAFADYGWTLFLLLPVVLGFSSAVIYSPRGTKSYWECLLVSMGSIVVVGALIVILAIEGIICLLMCLPLAVPLIAIGALIGWSVTRSLNTPTGGVIASMMLFLATPFLLGFEASHKSLPTVHTVVSTVEVNAPIEKVWQTVVAFPHIQKDPEGLLKLGFAYPISAEIEGSGVGAIRKCNFNTGPFVEPITTWQEPNLLAFDVKEQPAPMVEMSPYEHINAAHLQYIHSERGQFRLYEKDGKTVLEGTTFYTHDIAPDLYWSLFSDEIIHVIHMRVLDHIKEISEK